MSDTDILRVTSEIGKLRTVLLHRPGKELENLTPDLMGKLLFDEIPYLEVAAREHDAFAQVLKEQGVEVLYLEDLIVQAIEDTDVKADFLEAFFSEAMLMDQRVKEILLESFEQWDHLTLIKKIMTGIRKQELPNYTKSLTHLVDRSYPFILDPMPNLYFTRDPAATIGHGITLNKMKTATRNRETLFIKYIIQHHPRFKNQNIPIWFNREQETSLEGGDILILNHEVLAIGISERTEAASIEELALRILDKHEGFKTILAFNIPKKRAYMHLDTVFTMVDYHTFTIHHDIESPLTIFSITKGEENTLKIVEETATLEDILKKYLNLSKVILIPCAGGDKIDGPREQWNDGSNTLAIAPGEVVVYSRNYVTNQLLRDHGIKTHIIPSSELSRGRGGPRCMSMPLVRDDL